MKSSNILWDIALFSPMEVNRRFRGTGRKQTYSTLVSYLASFSSPKAEARCSETSVNFQRTAQRYIPQNRTQLPTVLPSFWPQRSHLFWPPVQPDLLTAADKSFCLQGCCPMQELPSYVSPGHKAARCTWGPDSTPRVSCIEHSPSSYGGQTLLHEPHAAHFSLSRLYMYLVHTATTTRYSPANFLLPTTTTTTTTTTTNNNNNNNNIFFSYLPVVRQLSKCKLSVAKNKK
jgi:hypothetical protein